MSEKRIENKSLTVSEIAKKANVSRNLVWAYIRKNKIKAIVKEKKHFEFDSSIVSEIKEKQKKKQEKSSEKVANDVVSENVLEILHQQPKVKDKQIKDQQATIDFLKGELIQSQLENSKNRKLLEDKKKKEEAMSANELKQEENKKKWWHFW